MTAPLYKNCEKPIKCEGNFGLWFERFFDQYDPRNWEVLKPITNNNQMGNTYWLLQNFSNKNERLIAKGSINNPQYLLLALILQSVPLFLILTFFLPHFSHSYQIILFYILSKCDTNVSDCQC